MNNTVEQDIQIYSPQSIIGIFNNALKMKETVSLVFLKGKYVFGQGKSYAGYFYDLLYSESSPISIGVKISNLLRSKIINNETYVLRGFIEKKIKNSSIELVFVIDEIIQQEERMISEDELKRFEILQKKLNQGTNDLESFIRSKKSSNQLIKIANIYGHNAIVQHDFYEGLGVARNEFIIDDYTCNITSSTSILDQLKELMNKDYDIIALVRGGGDRQSFDAFDDVKLADFFISIPFVTITAIGHSVDETLLDKLSDKRYNLPLDYGVGLYKIIEKLTEEKSNSRAALINEVKLDITKQFNERVKTLETQLIKKNQEFDKLQESSQKSVKDLSDEVQKMNKNHSLTIENLSKNHSLELDKTKKSLEIMFNKNFQLELANEKQKHQLEKQELIKEIEEIKNENSNNNLIVYIIIAIIVGLIIGALAF
ncbi:hypothetical protein OBK19_12375 [Empedobacter falsenii]|uniref:Exonuclease VII large subunit C-terminal domain-containing protein n=1 Tax=Empedobacter falsenii TaxID=343874 RepID=A0ABY8V938_9FLAO|nr:exodeoxyribonuclease VII large subunit [Empedobacter falsenii]WIH98210.1 hypothetical protein OBA43_04580 [Empedobacter falsenii]